MKKILLFLSFVFALQFAEAQVKEGMGGYATISAVTLVSGTTYNFTITGFNSNVRPRGQDSYTTLDISVGCAIWSTDCNKFVIASISSNTGITMVGTMTSIDAAQAPPTNGTRIAVFKEITTNNFTTYSLPPAADGNGANLFGIPLGMRACIDAHYRRQDSIAFANISGGGSLTANSVDSTHIKTASIAASDAGQSLLDTIQSLNHTNTNVPLIVLFGDSWSGGVVPIGQATTAELLPQPKVQIFNNNSRKFETLQIGVNNVINHQDIPDNSQMSFERVVANNANLFQQPIYFLKSGQGSSKSLDWGIGGAYFDSLRTKMRQAVVLLKAQGKQPQIHYWISLGTNDASAITLGGINAAYHQDSLRSRIETLFATLESEFGRAPIYQTRILTNTAGAGYGEVSIDSVIQVMSVQNTLYHCVPVTDVTTLDPKHLSKTGQDTVGLRLIRCVLDSVGLAQSYNTTMTKSLVTDKSTNAWGLTGTTALSSHFLGTTNANPLILKANNTEGLRVTTLGRVGIGVTSPTQKLEVNGNALINNLTIGSGSGNIQTNSVLGYQAFFYNTTGFQNVAVGNGALQSNTTGAFNVGIGVNAVAVNSVGNANTGVGNGALSFSTGSNNTALGYQSGYSNSTGSASLFIGTFAGLQNTTGSNNTVVGYDALRNNQTGGANVAVGQAALTLTTTSSSTVVGYQGFKNQTTGSGNIGLGNNVGLSTVTGSNNILIGNGINTPTSSTTGYMSINDWITASAGVVTIPNNLITNNHTISHLVQGSTSDSLVSSASGVLKRVASVGAITAGEGNSHTVNATIAAGANLSGGGTPFTVTVPGALVGDFIDFVVIPDDNDLTDIVIKAWVSATNTVSYQIENKRATSVVFTNKSVKARVRR